MRAKEQSIDVIVQCEEQIQSKSNELESLLIECASLAQGIVELSKTVVYHNEEMLSDGDVMPNGIEDRVDCFQKVLCSIRESLYRINE